MKKALVVDDEKELASMLVLRLAANGVEAEAAHDGKRGFERAMQTTPDVIITDLSMPGLDGWQLCEAIRAEPTLSEAWLIIMTAWNTPGFERRALDLGATLVLKPFDERRLARLISGSGGARARARREEEPS